MHLVEAICMQKHTVFHFLHAGKKDAWGAFSVQHWGKGLEIAQKFKCGSVQILSPGLKYISIQTK